MTNMFLDFGATVAYHFELRPGKCLPFYAATLKFLNKDDDDHAMLLCTELFSLSTRGLCALFHFSKQSHCKPGLLLIDLHSCALGNPFVRGPS